MKHIHEDGNKILSVHPLKMNFNDYLHAIDALSLERRIGKDNAEALKNDNAKAEKYLPPLKEDRYSIDDMKKDDIESFNVEL